MQGTTIEQAIGYSEEEFIEEPGAQPGEVEVQEERKGFNFKEMLTKRTGSGELSGYREHVLNFNNSSYMSRIIRGLTGMLGDLDFAIVDIAVGVVELLNVRRGANVNS